MTDSRNWRTFRVIQDGQVYNLIADQSEDVLNLLPGHGIVLDVDTGTDTITVSVDSAAIPQGNVGFTGSQGPAGGFTGSQGIQGFTGSQGPAGGFTGSQGFTGSMGAQGAQGFTGSAGNVGFTGSQGGLGYTGSQGVPGTFAAVGFTGSLGQQGYTGSRGATGNQGIQGFTGSIGFTGSSGAFAAVGFTGSKGEDSNVAGPVGFTGSEGPQGSPGFAGSQGNVGFTGSQGNVGFTGSQGNVGFTGSFGFTGSQGNVGFTGSQGLSVGEATIVANGNLFIGLVDNTNTIVSVIDAGSASGFTGSQGIQGNIGFTGSQGFTGSVGVGFTGSQGIQGFSGSVGAFVAGDGIDVVGPTISVDDSVLRFDGDQNIVVAPTEYLNIRGTGIGRQGLRLSADSNSPDSMNLHFVKTRLGGNSAVAGDSLGIITWLDSDINSAQPQTSIEAFYDPAGSSLEFTHGPLGNPSILRLTGGGRVQINEAYVLPNTDGTPGQVMVTNGAGVVQFANPGNISVATTPAISGARVVLQSNIDCVVGFETEMPFFPGTSTVVFDTDTYVNNSSNSFVVPNGVNYAEVTFNADTVPIGIISTAENEYNIYQNGAVIARQNFLRGGATVVNGAFLSSGVVPVSPGDVFTFSVNNITGNTVRLRADTTFATIRTFT